MRKIVILSLPW